MKQNKEQMLEKAIKVLRDINPDYFKAEDVQDLFFNEEGELSRPSVKVIPMWIVFVNDPIFDATECLVMSDENGEPLYYKNFNLLIHEIQKDADGNYF